MSLNDPLRRAIRTFIQTFLGLYLVKLVGFLDQLGEWAGCREGGGADACAFPDVSTLGYAAVAAGSAAVVALLAWGMNGLEDHTRFPSLLKAPASSGTNPVPDPNESGEIDLLYVAVIVLVIVVILAIIGVL